MIRLDPIGTVRTPFETAADAPRQGQGGEERGEIVLEDEYAAGLAGLEPDDPVDVLWYADRADRTTLRVRDGDRGVFATRAPQRPNPICVTPCRVITVDSPRVVVRGVDMLDDSPVLDLKATLR